MSDYGAQNQVYALSNCRKIGLENEGDKHSGSLRIVIN